MRHSSMTLTNQECERPRCAAAQQLETSRFFGGIQGWMSIQMRVILKDRNGAHLTVNTNELAILFVFLETGTLIKQQETTCIFGLSF